MTVPSAGPRPDNDRPTRRRPRRSIWLLAGALALALVVGLAGGWDRRSRGHDEETIAREQAVRAITGVREGELAELGTQLASLRGRSSFAYYFARGVSAEQLGVALSAAAPDRSRDARAGMDEPTYELFLTDLAGTLGLASRGSGEHALPRSWAVKFVRAALPTAGQGGAGGGDPARAAAAQNLLILLSRGSWSLDFLKVATEAFYGQDQLADGRAWPAPRVEGALYAPSTEGSYLTDGVVALVAALTSNPEAARWAFSEFRPGTVSVTLGGEKTEVGRFTDYLFFEHRFPEVGGRSAGMTAALTALGAASGAVPERSEELGTPSSDSLVLARIGKSAAPESDGTLLAKVWNAAKRLVSTVVGWVRRWGHDLLDVLANTIPPLSTAAAAVSATWYALEGDFLNAGLLAAAVIPGAALAVKAAKGLSFVARKGTESTALASLVSQAGPKAKAAVALGAEIEVLPRRLTFPLERDAEAHLVKTRLPDARRQVTFAPPADCATLCERRIVDIYDEADRTATEVKIGKRNTAFALKQVAKDRALLDDPSSGIEKIRWEFFPDADGRVGPNEKLAAWLRENDIPFTVHLPRL